MKQNQVVFVSATPANYEMELTEGVIVEQVIRPTGILDPTVEVRRRVASDGLAETRGSGTPLTWYLEEQPAKPGTSHEASLERASPARMMQPTRST